MNRKIVVIGSCNTDMVINMERLPLPGETLLGGEFFMNPGGKVNGRNWEKLFTNVVIN